MKSSRGGSQSKGSLFVAEQSRGNESAVEKDLLIAFHYILCTGCSPSSSTPQDDRLSMRGCDDRRGFASGLT